MDHIGLLSPSYPSLPFPAPKVNLTQREKHDLETRVNQLTERADMTDKKIKGQEDVTLALKDHKVKLSGIVGNDRVLLKVDARYEKRYPKPID